MTAPVLDAYVARLGRAVHGPVRVRRSILREVREGLTDAAEAHVAGGLDPGAAQARAVAEFGTVDELAELYQAELTVRRGRATALFVMLVFPGMVLAWDLLWRAGVSWDREPGPAELAIVRTLSTIVDTTSLTTAAAAAVMFALTFLRAAPTRLLTGLVGAAAGLGALVTAGLSAVMNVVGGHAVGAAVAAPGPALVAYAASTAVLVVSVVIAVRTLRIAVA
ncbi:permease prefix domain 1-containing protein [Pseudonocardia sp. CA-107938]|uniref:permease prefix domain 1-containing protein n=1 Tax=Pseudonocardia sp. CA-107938 TaxID=3240021 RepID=UPI003D9167E2